MIPRFDHPQFLLLGLLAWPLVWLGWRALRGVDPLRKTAILGLRAAGLLILAIMLAGPHLEQRHHQVTVIGLLDISGSVQKFADLNNRPRAGATLNPSGSSDADTPNGAGDGPALLQPTTTMISHRSMIDYLRSWFRNAVQLKEPNDRFGLIVFDGRSIAISVPTKSEDYVDDNLDVPMMEGTNIADALRLGLAMFPADTAKRIVLVTDGNETAGSAIEAARAAASDLRLTIDDFRLATGASSQSSIVNPKSSIPIDVLPIAYHVTGDVQIVRVESPPTAQPNQTVTVRIIMEATAPTSGSLTLKREGAVVDLNGSPPGTSRHIELPAGQSVQMAQVMLGETPINRFEAIFEPDDPKADVLPDNDRAESFTATPAKGAVLIVDRHAAQSTGLLDEILRAAKIPVTVLSPGEFPTDLLSLQNYDLIVLDDIAAAELSTAQQQLIARYVTDLGGGLIMAGGENSFGAGGWNNTPIADILPIELDPPKELRLPTAALALVLDKSGSMNQPVAGARASQQAVANEGAALAIQSLRSDSLVGVITFDMGANVLIPLQANEDPKRLAGIVRQINPDGGTNMEPALRQAHAMLKDAKVNRKRVVCMTDGRSITSDAMEDIARQMAADNIQLTTIAVGDDADHDLLRKLAEIGGGKFYAVRDPRMLPNVLVDSVQIINKPLIKEVPFTPQVLATGSTLTIGMSEAPELHGLVITGPRHDARVSLEMLDQSNDPLLAHWQIGLGRVAAFTSQTPASGTGKWAAQWVDWPTAATFWTQLARTMSRPAMSQDAELIATIHDDRLLINLELTGDQHESTYVQVEGTVYDPDGKSTPVKLRQTAAGRFEGSVEAPQSGNYIVALNPREGQRRLSPVIGGASKSTSPEFRKYQSNLALLEEIVEITNGRRLDIDDPRKVNLFDRSTLPWSVSSLPFWRNILWFTLLLVLMDVACRRIAWSQQTVQRALRMAMAKVTPSYVRGTKAAATLATLRRISNEADVRLDRDAKGIEKLASKGEIMPPPQRDEFGRIVTGEQGEPSLPLPQGEGRGEGEAPAAKKLSDPQRTSEPDSSKVSAALDALLGRTSSVPKAKPPTPPAPDPNAPSETTGSLLAAKRRARERFKPDQDRDSNS